MSAGERTAGAELRELLAEWDAEVREHGLWTSGHSIAARMSVALQSLRKEVGLTRERLDELDQPDVPLYDFLPTMVDDLHRRLRAALRSQPEGKEQTDLIDAVDAYLATLNDAAPNWPERMRLARGRLVTIACNWRATEQQHAFLSETLRPDPSALREAANPPAKQCCNTYVRPDNGKLDSCDQPDGHTGDCGAAALASPRETPHYQVGDFDVATKRFRCVCAVATGRSR